MNRRPSGACRPGLLQRSASPDGELAFLLTRYSAVLFASAVRAHLSHVSFVRGHLQVNASRLTSFSHGVVPYPAGISQRARIGFVVHRSDLRFLTGLRLVNRFNEENAMAGIDGIGSMQSAGPAQKMNGATDSQSTQNTDGAKPDIGSAIKELFALAGKILEMINMLMQMSEQKGQGPSAGNSASDPSADDSASDPSSDSAADPSSGGSEDGESSSDASPKSKDAAPNGRAGNALALIGKGMSDVGKGMMDLGGGGGGGIGQSFGA
jgi:hypothetical protein